MTPPATRTKLQEPAALHVTGAAHVVDAIQTGHGQILPASTVLNGH